MKKGIISFVACLIALGALIIAYQRGRNDVWVTEFKVCQANMLWLTYWDTNQPPALKEYVKARYYYLANRIPKSWLGKPCDYGAVSTNVADLAVFKGPSSGQSEYFDFLKRNGLTKSTP